MPLAIQNMYPEVNKDARISLLLLIYRQKYRYSQKLH